MRAIGARGGSWKKSRFGLSLRRFRGISSGNLSHFVKGVQHERNQVSWSGRAGKRGGRLGRKPDSTRLIEQPGRFEVEIKSSGVIFPTHERTLNMKKLLIASA